MPVDMDSINALLYTPSQRLLQMQQPLILLRHFDRSHLDRLSKPENTKGVFGARTPSLLLMTTPDERAVRNTLFHKERPYPFRSIDLMG